MQTTSRCISAVSEHGRGRTARLRVRCPHGRRPALAVSRSQDALRPTGGWPPPAIAVAMAGESASAYSEPLGRVARRSSDFGSRTPSTSRAHRGSRPRHARGRTDSVAAGKSSHQASIASTGTATSAATPASCTRNVRSTDPAGSGPSASRWTTTAATGCPAAVVAATAVLRSLAQLRTAAGPAVRVSEVGRVRAWTRPARSGLIPWRSVATLCASFRLSPNTSTIGRRRDRGGLTQERRRVLLQTTAHPDAIPMRRRPQRCPARTQRESARPLTRRSGRKR